MNIFKLLFELFLLYMLYKLVFDFIIPVYNTSKRMKEQVNQMHQKMREHQNPQPVKEENFVKNTTKPSGNQASAKDYIEFEEVR
jgi:sortase (surface protein transpeptidase)